MKLVAPSERAYLRRGLFAIELLDAVTLERVTQDVEIRAEGLRGKPIVNAGGLFAWLEEDRAQLRKITIDPGRLPYEAIELAPGDLTPRVTTVELQPRVSYAFAAGTTGIRGTLIETRVQPPVPVGGAAVRLRWLDVNGVWSDATTTARTTARGDFAAVLRLASKDEPKVDAAGLLTVRLRARRDGDERGTGDLQLPQGRIADARIFAWDELQP